MASEAESDSSQLGGLFPSSILLVLNPSARSTSTAVQRLLVFASRPFTTFLHLSSLGDSSQCQQAVSPA